MSKLRSINVPASTGVESTTKILVPSIAQQYIGSCISFNPGRLNLSIVAIKLIPPKIELPPRSKMLIIQINWPAAGVVILRGGYAVQPDCAAPLIK